MLPALLFGLAVTACRHESPSRGPAPPVAADFRVGSTTVELPGLCALEPVEARIRRMLLAFNSGRSEDFARNFAVAGQFHPYTSRISGVGFIGRKAIARFASERHEAGDAWTGTKLDPPLGEVGLPRGAVYGLEFRLTHEGSRIASAGAKLVVDCASGRVLTWIGPAVAPADVETRTTAF